MANLLETLGIRPEEMGGVVPVAGAFPKGGWQDAPQPAVGRLVNDTTGPFPPAGRFEYLGQRYEDLYKNSQPGMKVTPQPVAQTQPERPAWERFLDSAYGAAMTPLPKLTPLDLAPLMEKLKAAREAIPSLPEKLPVMPEWLHRYAIENGLFPEQRQVPPVPVDDGPSSARGISEGARRMLQPDKPVKYSPTGY